MSGLLTGGNDPRIFRLRVQRTTFHRRHRRSSGCAPCTFSAMSQEMAPSTAASTSHEPPVERARPLMEVTGILLILAAYGVQVGYVVTAADLGSDSGDFFSIVGNGQQLSLSLLVVIGVFVAVAPRLLFGSGVSVSSAVPMLVSLFGSLLAVSSVVFAAGATITAIDRRSNEDLPSVAGEWVFTAGVTVAALASLVFCVVAALVTSPGSRRPRPQPV